MSIGTEEKIRTIAEAQHGIVTRRQLLGVGMSAPAVQRRISCGLLRPRHRGVYAVGPLESPVGWAMAAILAAGPGAVISHTSALVLRGVVGEVDGPPPSPVDVRIDAGRRGPRRPGLRVHRSRSALPASDRELVRGIPTTTLPRTIFDAAGQFDRRTLEGLIGRAQREHAVTTEALEALMERYPGHRGILALRAVVGREGGAAFTRSEAERRFLGLVREADLPTPRTNVRVGRYEVDFLWGRERLVVEVDGFRHHGSRAGFERDRAKDAWLQSRGLRVLRLSWKQVVRDPVATAVAVGRALMLSVR